MSSEWLRYRLGDIAITQSGGTPSRSNNSFFNGEIPWVKSGELNDSTIYASEEKISTEAIQSSSAKVFEPNTLLLAMYGATVGKTGILKIRASTNQAVCAIRPKENNFDIEFLKFYLIFIRPQLLRERYGGAQPNISQTLIQDLQIPLPLLEEQKKIATILLEIQKAIEIQESIIEKTRELKKSTLHHIFTYGLRGEKLKETEIGLMPESWNLIKIGECCDVRSSTISFNELNQGRPENKDVFCHAIKVSDMNLPGNEKYIFSANIEVRLSLNIVSEKAIPAYAVIFPKRGAAIATNKKRITTQWSLLDPNLIAIIPRTYVTSEFLYYWFLIFDLAGIQDLGPTPQLNKKDVDPISIPCPSESEQVDISNVFRSIDDKIDLHAAKKSALQDLFKTMLNKLMTGEIRVNDLDIDVSEVFA